MTLLAQSYGIVLMTRPDFPAKTLPEFVALARRSPGKYSYGHAGIGNVTYVAAELFAEARRHRAAQGALSWDGLVRARHHVRPCRRRFHVDRARHAECAGGLLRALGISGSQRAPTLPDVPTFQELGFKEMDVTGYFGLWFPAGTPRERVALIHREAVEGAARRRC